MNLAIRIGIAFLCIAAVFAFFIVPTVSEEWRKGSEAEFFVVGPKLLPYLSAASMALLSLLLIASGLRERRRKESQEKGFWEWEKAAPVIVSIAIAAAYILLLPLLGFLIATPICMAVYFWYYGLKRRLFFAILVIAVPLIVYYCFYRLISVPLPRGLLD